MGIIESTVDKMRLESAFIYIDDTSDREDNVVLEAVTGKRVGLGDYGNAMAELQSQAAQAVGEAAQNAIQSTMERMTSNFSQTVYDMMVNRKPSNPNLVYVDGAVKRKLQVQFNPSSFNINAFGGGKVQATNFTNGAGKSISYEKADANIQMSVQLVFDELSEHPFSVFAKDSVAGLVNAGARMGLQKLGEQLVKLLKINGKKKLPVQDKVEAFLGAIRSPETRYVTFVWGPMAYFGIINGVNAKYTLFDYKGVPIRAIVEFNMICADATVAKGNLGYWGKQYERL